MFYKLIMLRFIIITSYKKSILKIYSNLSFATLMVQWNWIAVVDKNRIWKTIESYYIKEWLWDCLRLIFSWRFNQNLSFKNFVKFIKIYKRIVRIQRRRNRKTIIRKSNPWAILMEWWIKCPIKKNSMHAFSIKYDRKRKTNNERNIFEIWFWLGWQNIQNGTILPHFIR